MVQLINIILPVVCAFIGILGTLIVTNHFQIKEQELKLLKERFDKLYYPFFLFFIRTNAIHEADPPFDFSCFNKNEQSYITELLFQYVYLESKEFQDQIFQFLRQHHMLSSIRDDESKNLMENSWNELYCKRSQISVVLKNTKTWCHADATYGCEWLVYAVYKRNYWLRDYLFVEISKY